MNRKGRHNPKELPGTPRRRFTPRSELHLLYLRRGSHGFAGLAPHFGRSSLPRSVLLCSGAGRLPYHHRAQWPSRQPRKYRQNNKSCQLDSLREINLSDWLAPCSCRRSESTQNNRAESVADPLLGALARGPISPRTPACIHFWDRCGNIRNMQITSNLVHAEP